MFSPPYFAKAVPFIAVLPDRGTVDEHCRAVLPAGLLRDWVKDPRSSMIPEIVLSILDGLMTDRGFFSFGVCANVVAAEVFPSKYRARALGVTLLMNRVTSAAQAVSFVTTAELIGTSNLFFILAGVSAAAGIFVAAVVPETQGKSLEEIEIELHARYMSDVPRGVLRGGSSSNPSHKGVETSYGT